MIVDASALIAIVNQEPDARELAEALERADRLSMSAASLLEACVVADFAPDARYGRRLDELVRAAAVEIEPFTAEHAAIAREAYRLFGRGSGHAAKLNLGDFFAYATAYAAGEPLLFKGGDFIHTDIKPAI